MLSKVSAELTELKNRYDLDSQAAAAKTQLEWNQRIQVEEAFSSIFSELAELKRGYDLDLQAAAAKTRLECTQRIQAQEELVKQRAELDELLKRYDIELQVAREKTDSERSLRVQREGELVKLRAVLAEVREHLSWADQELSNLGSRLSESERQANFYRGELHLAMNSRSWKVTRPLRALNAVLSGRHDDVSAKIEPVATKAEPSRRSRQWIAMLTPHALRASSSLRRIAKFIPLRYRRRLQFQMDLELLSQSALFDANWYLANNPDVANAGADPLSHFLQYGAQEGRDPSENFSTSRYLEDNPDVRQAGVNPLVHYLRRGAIEGRRLPPVAAVTYRTVVETPPYDVFAYMSYPIDYSALPRRVAVGVSSLGNFFMAEIAYMIEDAFRNLGVATRLFAEHEASAVAAFEEVVIVAPHEFFLLGDGPSALQALQRVPRLLMFNVEQPQTQWFRAGEQYLPHASAVLDINYHTARHLARSGHKSFFFPLGYSNYIERTFNGRELPDHDIFKHMSSQVRDFFPASYAERPIDILFIGASSPRRNKFFSRHASYFAAKNSFIYLPDTTRPFLVTEPRTIDFAAFVSLVRRSKILLNVHQDDVPFLEWQRIVNLGIMQQTLVVSEHCEPVPCIEPNVDYLDGPSVSLPELCEFALNNLHDTECIVERAYTKLKTQYPMEQILAKCWTTLATVLDDF